MIRLISLAAVLLAASGASAETTALVGATVHHGTGAPATSDAVVIVEGDRIACVGTRDACPVPADASVVDLAGRHVTPGLVDGHVHYAQTGWVDGRPDSGIATDHYDYAALQASLRDDPDRWHRAYLCAGVTAVYDVGGLPWTLGVGDSGRNRHRRPHYQSAGPLMTAYEPIFGVMSALGADTFLPMQSDAEALESVARLVELGADAVKVWYIDPSPGERAELDARLRLIGDRAREAGLPLLVHATELRNAKAALRAGAAVLVHSVDDRLVDEEFLTLLEESGAFYAPTLTVSGNWRRAVASAMLGVDAPPIDDPNGCVDAETHRVIAEADELVEGRGAQGRPSREQVARAFSSIATAGESTAIARLNLRRVVDAGGPVVTSTDAGNPLTLHGPSIYAEMEAMASAGLSPEAILVMSTRNGAAAMGRLDDFGTLSAGKLADLIVLEDDPSKSVGAYRSITHVMRAGDLAPVKEYAAP
jgi:imidazolonepropionase-like amidohydrolase